MLGFTTRFLPGGTFRSTFPSRVFKLKYAKQLLAAIDFLNLKLGLQHSDIVPRNLLLDEKDDLILFDFDHGSKIGGRRWREEHDDVSGVILTFYELVTGDFHYREGWPGEDRVRDWESQDAEDALALQEWKLEGRLDCEVGELRSLLNAWVVVRKEKKDGGEGGGEAFGGSEIPILPGKMVFYGKDGEPLWCMGDSMSKREAKAKGIDFFEWEREPSEVVERKGEEVKSKKRKL
jgi:serine/threonine protein kinase